jgi:hypothetical protein
MSRPALAVLLAFFATGCANYHLGTQGRLAFTTLYVEPVRNNSMLPQAQATVSAEIRKVLEEDGRLVLVNSSSAADATLSVTLTEYRRDVAAVREVDTGLASKFNLTLGAMCTLHDNRAGKAFFADRLLEVQRDAFTDNGDPHSSAVGNQLQSEYNTLPLLAESLADRVAHTVLDVW